MHNGSPDKCTNFAKDSVFFVVLTFSTTEEVTKNEVPARVTAD
jgi:hypothetical protein